MASRRRHGGQWPWSKEQVGAWVVLAGCVAGCYAFQLCLLDRSSASFAVLVTIYTICVALVLGLGAASTLSDPSDAAVQGGEGTGDFYCTLCQVSVGRNSKHCKHCDRCVDHFDHHCTWLNNCVGGSNYSWFFALVCAVTSMLTVQLATALWLFITSFTQKAKVQAQVEASYTFGVSFRGWQGMLVIYMLLLGGCICMLGELLVFHLVLISRGLSTYEFIVSQRAGSLQPNGVATLSQPSALESVCSLFWHLLTCQVCAVKGRVHDEASATQKQQQKDKPQVSLNPCMACTAHKLEGDLRDWDKQQQRGSPAARPTGATAAIYATPDGKPSSPYPGTLAHPVAAPGGHAAAVVKAASPGGEGRAGPVPEHVMYSSGAAQQMVRATPQGLLQSASVLVQQALQAYGGPVVGAVPGPASMSPIRQPMAAQPSSPYGSNWSPEPSTPTQPKQQQQQQQQQQHATAHWGMTSSLSPARTPPMQRPWQPPADMSSAPAPLQAMMTAQQAHNSVAMARHLGSRSPVAHEQPHEAAAITPSYAAGGPGQVMVYPAPATAPRPGLERSPSLRLPPISPQARQPSGAQHLAQGSPWKTYEPLGSPGGVVHAQLSPFPLS